MPPRFLAEEAGTDAVSDVCRRMEAARTKEEVQRVAESFAEELSKFIAGVERGSPEGFTEGVLMIETKASIANVEPEGRDATVEALREMCGGLLLKVNVARRKIKSEKPTDAEWQRTHQQDEEYTDADLLLEVSPPVMIVDDSEIVVLGDEP